MHVLIIPSWYKMKGDLLKGSFFEEQARGLKKRNHKVGILYPQFKSFSSGKIKEDYQVDDNGIQTWYTMYKSIIPRNYRLNYLLYSKKVYRVYLDYVAKYGKPDIIHAHTVYYAGIAANYISKKTNVPYVLTEHFTPFITGGITNPIDLAIAKEVFNASAKNIIVSKGFKKLLTDKLNLPKDSFAVVHNMVHDHFFTNAKTYSYSEDAPVFFTISFLTERKNHKLMIESFAKFLNKVPNAIFEIGGDGEIMSDLVKLTEDLKITKNVIFLGEMSREQVGKKMEEIDIFLLASKFETFGVVLIEALANGKPVVTTDSIGPRDIVNEDNGIITKSFSVDDFEEGMFQSYSKYRTYNRSKIVNDCASRFSEKVIIKQLEGVYDLSI